MTLTLLNNIGFKTKIKYQLKRNETLKPYKSPCDILGYDLTLTLNLKVKGSTYAKRIKNQMIKYEETISMLLWQIWLNVIHP